MVISRMFRRVKVGAAYWYIRCNQCKKDYKESTEGLIAEKYLFAFTYGFLCFDCIQKYGTMCITSETEVEKIIVLLEQRNADNQQNS